MTRPHSRIFSECKGLFGLCEFMYTVWWNYFLCKPDNIQYPKILIKETIEMWIKLCKFFGVWNPLIKWMQNKGAVTSFHSSGEEYTDQYLSFFSFLYNFNEDASNRFFTVCSDIFHLPACLLRFSNCNF